MHFFGCLRRRCTRDFELCDFWFCDSTNGQAATRSSMFILVLASPYNFDVTLPQLKMTPLTELQLSCSMTLPLARMGSLAWFPLLSEGSENVSGCCVDVGCFHCTHGVAATLLKGSGHYVAERQSLRPLQNLICSARRLGWFTPLSEYRRAARSPLVE